MAELVSQIFNMTLTGSVVIGAVLLVRACIRKLPKIFSYALWSVVLFRLLCPASLSAPGSLLQLLQPQVQKTSDTVSVVSYLPVPEDLPEFQYVAAAIPQEQPDDPEKSLSAGQILGTIWITVAGGMMLYGAVQYLQLRKRLVGAICCRGNVYLADHINTAFVMGIFSPKIYLPSYVPKQEQRFILAHERHHIRRGDHIMKLLAYLALCIHWFNPLVWVAFILEGKDMEMSCDEAVIRHFGSQIRAEYSASLLRLAARRKPVPGMPLAFGEGDTKGRIMNMAKWKKPNLFRSILCGILCIAVLAACGVNPKKDTQETLSTNSSNMESVPRENADPVNILLVVLPEEEEAAKLGNCTMLLSLDKEKNAATIQSIPGSTVVDLPDYQAHITGSQPFQYCYALGYVWGGRTAAMEMTNQCLQDAFDIQVNYNAELTWADVQTLIDTLGKITLALEETDLEDLRETGNTIFAETKPGSISMNGKTAAAYAYPQKSEDDPMAAQRSGLRQRKLLAAVVSAVGNNPQLALDCLPSLYRAEDLNGIPCEWSEILNVLEENPSIYLGSGESEHQTVQPSVSGMDIVTDVELIQYGSLKLVLPQGYTSYAKENMVVLTRDGVDVGGIQCFQEPDAPFDYTIEYLRAMGLPEAQESGEPIAYMIGNDVGGGMIAEFFHELKPETLNVEHHLYLEGGLVYDVYYDQNILTDGEAEKFLKTVELKDTPIHPAQPEKDQSLQLCRNVLEAVQSGSYQISVDRKNEGDHALNKSSATLYTSNMADWVSITHVPDDDSYHGYMYVNDCCYSNEGNGWDESGAVNWAQDPYPDEIFAPWIARFRWNEENISYMDTLTDSGRKTVMLRIDEPFSGYEDLSECYFVNMRFAEDGSFLNAQISVDFLWENDVASVEMTESIVTLENEAVGSYILEEYTRAVSLS